MRGQQLTRLISMLRAELGRSTNVSVGVDDAEILINALQTRQQLLYDEYDWPHLRQVFPAVPLQAGQRYYDPPAGLNFDRIEDAKVRISGMPVRFRRGIDIADYAIFDSDADVRAAPPVKWDIRWVDTAEQIEVWPIPPDNACSMQFKGIRKLRPLVDGNHVTDLDDLLIVFFAAADLMEKQEAGSGQIKLKEGQARFARLKGRSAGARPDIRLGMGSQDTKPFRATIAISGR